jgi:hypothetical protein
MFQLFPLGNQFMIAYNVRTIEANVISGTRSRRAENTRLAYGRCWTGEKWASQNCFGMKFDSAEAARIYMAENDSLLRSKFAEQLGLAS